MPRKKTLITGPYPTAEDYSRIYGMSMARIRRIQEDAKRIMAERDALEARKRAAKRRQKVRVEDLSPSRNS